MATKTTTTRTRHCDMDPRAVTGVTNVTFSLNGVQYEIDLSPRYQQSLQHVLAPFIANARPAKVKPEVSKRDVAARKQELTVIRAWARRRGYEVSDRGRLAQDILNAYYNQEEAA